MGTHTQKVGREKGGAQLQITQLIKLLTKWKQNYQK